MITLREAIQKARSEKKAIGHFNISNLEAFHGIYEAAKEINVPVIIGVSEKERDFVGIEEVVALVKTIREKDNFPIFLNADHTYSYERVKEAIDAGFDSVIFDGAQLSFEENAKKTKDPRDANKSLDPQYGHQFCFTRLCPPLTGGGQRQIASQIM